MPSLFGKGSRKAYRQIYQSDSDISDTDEDEKVIFRQPGDLELNLVPNNRGKRSRQKTLTKANCKKIIILTCVALVVVVVMVAVVAKLRYHEGDVQVACYSCDWNTTLKEYTMENGVQLLDVDGDGKDDIVFGAAKSKAAELLMNLRSTNNSYSFLRELCRKQGEAYPCTGMVFALRGYDGKELWRMPVHGVLFNMNCDEFDLDQDGKMDCIGTGRMGAVVAFNPYTGRRLWMAESESHLQAGWNTYQARPLPDWDGDHIPEVLIVNGGDPSKAAKDHNRASGRLMILSGASGKPLGDRYLKIPGDKETYMSPVMYRQKDGSQEYILFGSGGETVPGDLLGISVADFCHYILGSNFPKCPSAQNLTWSNLHKDEQGIFVIYRGEHKGMMVPPVVVDMNNDGVMDVVVSAFDGAVILLDGKTMMPLWRTNFTGMESYTTPAPGYYDDDEVLDFMVHWNIGTWDGSYNQSVVVVLSGKTGEELWRSSSIVDIQASDLTISTNLSQHDLFVFRKNKMANSDQEQVPRSRRHGGGQMKPAGAGNHMGFPWGAEDLIAEGFAHSKEYYTKCSSLDNARAEEVLLLDRSSANKPVKILELAPAEYHYIPKYMGDNGFGDFDEPVVGALGHEAGEGEQEENQEDHHVELHSNTGDTQDKAGQGQINSHDDDDDSDNHNDGENDNESDESHTENNEGGDNIGNDSNEDKKDSDDDGNKVISDSVEDNSNDNEDDNQNVDGTSNIPKHIDKNDSNIESHKQDLDKDHRSPDDNHQEHSNGREGGRTTTTTTAEGDKEVAGQEGKGDNSEGQDDLSEGREVSKRSRRGAKRGGRGVQQFCSFSQPDVGSTGALGDVDGDGLIDYISVVKFQAKEYDPSYSQTGFHDYTVIHKVSLEKLVHGYHGNKVEAVNVGAKTSLKSGEETETSLKSGQGDDSAGFESVPTFLPLKQQKWTKYMGAKGNNWYT